MDKLEDLFKNAVQGKPYRYENKILRQDTPPMPPVKPPKKPKIQRIYEDDDFIIDLFSKDKTVRVSIFKDNHFQDEVFVRKTDYED